MPAFPAVSPIAAMSGGLALTPSFPRPGSDCHRNSDGRGGGIGQRPARRAASLTAMLVGLLAMLARSQPNKALNIARALDPREPPGLRLVARLLMDCFGWYSSSPNSRFVWAPDLDAHTAPLPAGKRKVIFLGPSCGHVSYTMGFTAGVLEDSALLEEMRAADAVFGGASSGALAAMYANAELHGVGNVTFWHRRDMLELGLNVDRYSPSVLGHEVEKVGRAYYQTCARAVNGTGDVPYTGSLLDTGAAGTIPWLSAFPMLATEAGTLRPHFTSSHQDGEDEFVSALVASCFIPVVFGFWPWVLVRGQRLFDGYIGMWLAFFPSSYLFVSFLRTMPPELLRAANKLPVDSLFDTSAGGFVTKSWPWGDTAWNVERFERGRADVQANRDAIRARIIAFLQE